MERQLKPIRPGLRLHRAHPRDFRKMSNAGPVARMGGTPASFLRIWDHHPFNSFNSFNQDDRRNQGRLEVLTRGGTRGLFAGNGPENVLNRAGRNEEGRHLFGRLARCLECHQEHKAALGGGDGSF